MGKNDFMSPKDIANRIKAKGLQKLRWYCQMCQKQCRDENGFKCHCASEGHQRMMSVLGENPDRFLDGFSEEFEKTFLDHLRMSHRFTRVQATVAYNEYIGDRHHIHMNSTKWTTLTEFVKYLGREGKCEVDETPKGWFVKYVDCNPFEALKNKDRLRRAKHDKDDEERQLREVEAQAERAAMAAGGVLEANVEATELQRDSEGGDNPIGFKLGGGRKLAAVDAVVGGGSGAKRPKLDAFADVDEGEGEGGSRGGGGGGGGGALDSMMREDEAKRERQNRKDYWLFEGLVVKVMSKELREAGYYKKKGRVDRVHGRYVGEVCMLDSGDVLKVDQAQLETVLPQPGGTVLVVNGAYRGERATLERVDLDKYKAVVRVTGGVHRGKEVSLDYEDVCKYSMKRQ